MKERVSNAVPPPLQYPASAPFARPHPVIACRKQVADPLAKIKALPVTFLRFRDMPRGRL